MSAEPASRGIDPTAGNVLSFRKKPAVGRSRRARGARPAAPAPAPGSELTPQQKLAATLEARFAAAGRTLTDEHTAEAFLITLAQVRTLLEGAHTKDMLTDDAYRDLDAMLEGMMGAPKLLH